MNWYNLINPERTEIVFATRNKAYGGYVIRRNYEKNVLMAFFITATLISSVAILPSLLKPSQALIDDVFAPRKDPIVILDPDILTPPAEPRGQSQPKPPGNPNPRSGKFTVPIVSRDTVIDLPPSQNQFDSTLLASAGSNSEGSGPVDMLEGLGQPADNSEPLTVVDEMPSFPGGEGELLKYLASHIHYSSFDKENKIQGQVFINFTVDRNGNVRDVRLLRGIGGNCDDEAMRVVSNMPKWRPGRQRGTPVAVYYILPVNFVLK